MLKHPFAGNVACEAHKEPFGWARFLKLFTPHAQFQQRLVMSRLKGIAALESVARSNDIDKFWKLVQKFVSEHG